MASQSRSRPLQRPSSPGRASPVRQSSQTSNSPKSAISEDSQTVLLDKPSQPQPNPSDEPRKCWICFSDETEDTPTSSAWRSPCPCALRAHESCLLDWVADLEGPNRKRRQGNPSKIECPQCKSEIVIARPRSYVVEGVNAIEAATGRLVVPMILGTLAGSLVAGCWLHGYSTIYVLFGAEDFSRMLNFKRGGGIASITGVSGNLGLGLPLVPIVLVLSRTSLADSVLPVLPIFFLGSQIPRRQGSSLWPPSAAMMLATLPYLRGIYNGFYKRVLAPRERAWLKEIQPRAEEPVEEPREAPPENEVEIIQGGLNFELGLEVEIFEQEVDQANPAPPPNPEPALPPAEPARQQNIVLSTSRLADTIIGALLFPSISATMGALLSLVLPRSWTSRPGNNFWVQSGPTTGLLQSRFGRSVVGGCLFVVLKDAVVLYSRFRLAKVHRERRVVDWGGREGRGGKKSVS